MKPEDLMAAADFLDRTFRPHVGQDWRVQAGSLEWDVATTVAHLVGGIAKHTVYIAAAATRWSPVIVSAHAEAGNDNLLDGVAISTRALAFVAAHADPSTRGFHAYDMSDPTGFLARAAREALVHGWDAAQGLAIEFAPGPELCAPVVARNYPWATDDDPWQTLLTATGRNGGTWWPIWWQPIDTWDGSIPADHRAWPPAVAWSWDADMQE